MSELEKVAYNEENGGFEESFVKDFLCIISDCEFSKKDPQKRSTSVRSSTILNLPVYLGCRILSSLVPNRKLDPEDVQDFACWVLTNHKRLHKLSLESSLRWINCVLQYQVCPVEDLQCLYEPFFHLLDLRTAVSNQTIG